MSTKAEQEKDFNSWWELQQLSLISRMDKDVVHYIYYSGHVASTKRQIERIELSQAEKDSLTGASNVKD